MPQNCASCKVYFKDNRFSLLLSLFVDLDERLRCITEIREAVEIAYSSEYPMFLQHLMPAFEFILETVKPSFMDDKVHKLRNTILETISRLPMNEQLKQYSFDLHKRILATFQEDNEDNALIALKPCRSARTFMTFEKEASVYSTADDVPELPR